MEFKWRIFAVALLFSLMSGAISSISPFLPRILDLKPQEFAWVSFAVSVAAFFVSPVLLFAFLYLMGRKIDLVAEFSLVVVPLFLGSWFGHLIGYFPLQFFYIALFGSSFFGPWVLGFV